MAMQQDYTWRFTTPRRTLAVHMDNWQNGSHLFDATLVLRRREISAAALARVLVQYPLMTTKVIGTIHWQALKLWLKRCPFYPHPKSLTKGKRLCRNYPPRLFPPQFKKRSLGLGGWLDRWARRLVLGQLQRLQRGAICLVRRRTAPHLRAGRRRSRSGFAGPPSALFPRLSPRGHHRRGRSLHAGGGGVATICRLCAAWQWPIWSGCSSASGGWARLAAPARVLAHALKRNTLRGSQRNIAAHYDLSNDFFRLFLDDNMMYSSAVFPRPDSSLEEASRLQGGSHLQKARPSARGSSVRNRHRMGRFLPCTRPASTGAE